jgi:UDP-N-acetylglucosamine acyltransferase
MNNDNFIHPTAIVEEGVVLGKSNYIGPFCYIKSGVVIGSNNRFEAYCSIGTAPEHREYFTEYKYSVVIGDDNVFREYVTINAGSEKDTIVKSNVTMLRGSHIGHDSEVWNKVTLSCNALVGGHSIVMEGVNMGLGSTCHQFTVLGPYAMIGMGGVVTKSTSILPGKIYAGIPAKLLKDNIIGIQRSGLTEQEYTNLKNIYENTCSMH